MIKRAKIMRTLDEASLTPELQKLLADQRSDKRRDRTGRTAAKPTVTRLAPKPIRQRNRREVVDDEYDSAEEPQDDDDDDDTIGRETRAQLTNARDDSERGSFGAHREQLSRSMFRRHLVRLMIIDPVAATIGSMRWLNSRPATIAEIVELLGRAQSTVKAALRVLATRTYAFSMFPPPNPLTTYVLARTAGLSVEVAGFAFWFGYTLSAERAAELSGCGRSGASSARKDMLRQLERAALRDGRLRDWFARLQQVVRAAEIIRTGAGLRSGVKLVSTTLGKRRRGLHAEVALGQTPKPIQWLEQIEDDPSYASKIEVERLEEKVLLSELKRLSRKRRERAEIHPVLILRRVLEERPSKALDAAFELSQRELPYGDAFRDASRVTKRRTRGSARARASARRTRA